MNTNVSESDSNATINRVFQHNRTIDPLQSFGWMPDLILTMPSRVIARGVTDAGQSRYAQASGVQKGNQCQAKAEFGVLQRPLRV